MNGSPLGKYAAPSAAIGALLIIAVDLGALVFGHQLGVTDGSQNQLNLLAALAAGALFGASVAVNGYKAPIDAANRNIDQLAQAAASNRAAILGSDTTGRAQGIITHVDAAMAGQSATSVLPALPLPPD